ncbi:MAG: hypothetical protein M1821_002017 [Bathelium mastoideum]|nr:MAG: hypothetical protein M1821_002017 [Bathelium mastoideum]KAI9692523.1 MAG: hypothetical protein M1822_006754 [Bathelium mastoideum]
MVSTRNHPKNFPPPTLSPSKRASTPTTSNNDSDYNMDTNSPTKRDFSSDISLRASGASQSGTSTTQWTHIPSRLTLIWLALSLPLVAWDTGYVLLRPHSMPGGTLHRPLWIPYALYGEVDHIYGFKAWEAHNGFTAAQGTLNVVESVGYAIYLWILVTYGRETGPGRKGKEVERMGVGVGLGWLGEGRAVAGRVAAWAVLVGFGTSLMTVSKTVLYWLNEAFSGFDNIGHNNLSDLVFCWIIPNGLWLVLPSYMIYVFGQEILDGLESAAESKKSR